MALGSAVGAEVLTRDINLFPGSDNSFVQAKKWFDTVP